MNIFKDWDHKVELGDLHEARGEWRDDRWSGRAGFCRAAREDR